MKTKTRSIYQVKAGNRIVGELVGVLMGRPSKLVGHAIIKDGDKDGAKFFDNYESAVTEFCDTFNIYGVVESDVYRHSYWTDVHSFPESDDLEIQGFYDRLENLGFKIEHTGGGCTWWAKYFDDGQFMAVTQDGDKQIFRDHLKECGISIGLYSGNEEDSEEGEYFASETVEDALATLNVLSALKDSKVFDINRKGEE